MGVVMTLKLLDEAILNKYYRPINLLSKSLKQQKQKLPYLSYYF